MDLVRLGFLSFLLVLCSCLEYGRQFFIFFVEVLNLCVFQF